MRTEADPRVTVAAMLPFAPNAIALIARAWEVPAATIKLHDGLRSSSWVRAGAQRHKVLAAIRRADLQRVAASGR